MGYCDNCGALMDDDVKFCGICGSKVSIKQQDSNSNVRKTVYEGIIHKCPNCGAEITSFVQNCPDCGYELRDTEASESVVTFSKRYAMASSNRQKADLIRTYIIPNTKEDILEFIILASSNVETGRYAEKSVVVKGDMSQQELSETWMVKLEQAYQKASLILSESPELKMVEKIYAEKKASFEYYQKNKVKEKRRRNTLWIKIVAFSVGSMVLLYVLLFWLIWLDDGDQRKFDKQVAAVQKCIDEKNYEKALTLAYSMDTSWSDEYDGIQNNLISRILELKGDSRKVAKIPEISSDVKYTYAEIEQKFISAGFTNVVSEKVFDLKKGQEKKDGTVIEVYVDGSTDFNEGSFCDVGVRVVIKYHCYIN